MGRTSLARRDLTSPAHSGNKRERVSDHASAGWVRFGWQGITCRVPPEWSLGAIGGDNKQGYLRLDDAERSRLEVKWNRQEANLERALEKYLRAMSRPRGMGHRRITAEVKRGEKVVSNRALPGKRPEGFTWQDGPELSGAGVIWYCPECRRTVFGQVRGYGREDAVALARKVFGSMEDHATAGRQLWALYGLEVEVPENYYLVSQSLMAGYLELCFQSGRRRLRVGRWGLAETVLAGGGLQEWFEGKSVNRKSELRWQPNDSIVKGHAGLGLEGKSRRPAVQLYRAVSGPAWRRLGRGDPRETVDGRGWLWHCPETNRIYLVESVYAAEAELLEQVLETIICH